MYNRSNILWTSQANDLTSGAQKVKDYVPKQGRNYDAKTELGIRVEGNQYKT